MSRINRQIVLVNRPAGVPEESDFELREGEVPSPGEGQFLVRTLWVSVDPYLRGLIRENTAYFEPVPLGGVMAGGAAGRVVESHHPKYAEGDIVVGHWGWQDYALSDGSGTYKFDPALGPLSTSLGILGMPGMTAYFGFLEIGQPKAGEEVFVSGAAGAVGSAVGQIARIKQCRATGSAGSDAKIRFITDEIGFNEAFNYKALEEQDAEAYGRMLDKVCPRGIDVYFDNVGGPLTDAVFPRLNPGARVVVCGQIDQYNAQEPPKGPRLLWHLIVKQARAEGFLVFQFQDRYPEGMKQMAQWIRDGRIVYRETIAEGLEKAPDAFIGLFHGENIGKQLVHVAEE
jgi:hypothetical protein